MFGLDLLVIHSLEITGFEPDFLSKGKGFEVGLDVVIHAFLGNLMCCEGFFADLVKKSESFLIQEFRFLGKLLEVRVEHIQT